MDLKSPTLYECRPTANDPWRKCSVTGCLNERRINMNLDPVLRLERYKQKLDAGQGLNELEQQDLEEIARQVKAVIESFFEALQEAFKPVVEVIARTVHDLWESLPKPMKVELLQAAEPRLEFKLGDVATPYSADQNRIFGLSPYDMPTIQQNRDMS